MEEKGTFVEYDRYRALAFAGNTTTPGQGQRLHEGVIMPHTWVREVQVGSTTATIFSQKVLGTAPKVPTRQGPKTWIWRTKAPLVD